MKLYTDNLGKVSITIEEDYWSINKDYDKLTIVEKEGAFGTFISRKPVPAGTPLTDRTYWIPFSSLKEEIVLQFNELLNNLNALDLTVSQKETEIYKAMAAMTAGGLVLKQTFGYSELVGISQKAITEKIDFLQDQINNLHPGIIGIKITATPSVIYKGVETTVTIHAWMADSNVAESITLTIGETVITRTNVSEVEEEIVITDAATVNVVAVREGFTYEDSITISETNPYYVGSIDNPLNMLTDDYKQPAKVNPYGTYNITVPQNEYKIYFIVPIGMTIHKATFNGFNFPLEYDSYFLVDGYEIYASTSTLDAGTYQIVIS